MPLSFFVADLTFWFFFGGCWNNKQICSSRQIQLLCYNQELACTPNDPPRRVNMNETNFKNMYGIIVRVIDKTVSKPTLVKPIRFAEIISAVTVIPGIINNAVFCYSCCNGN